MATPGVTIAQVQIFTSENNPFGAVTGGWIDLKGLLFRVENTAKSTGNPREKVIFIHYMHESWRLHVRFDVFGEVFTEIFALPLIYTYDYMDTLPGGPVNLCGILVQPSSQYSGAFERLGWFMSDPIYSDQAPTLFSTYEPRDIRLL